MKFNISFNLYLYVAIFYLKNDVETE